MRVVIIDDLISKDQASMADFAKTNGIPQVEFSFLDAFDHSNGVFSIGPVISALTQDADLPDLVLLDVNFGSSGRIGYDILDWLTAEMPTIPVIMMTAEERQAHLDDALLGGAVDYIAKPFKKPELWSLIWRYIGPSSDLPVIGQNDQTMQGVFLIDRFLHGSAHTLLIQASDPLDRKSLSDYARRLAAADAGVVDLDRLESLRLVDDVSTLTRREQLKALRESNDFLASDATHKVIAFTSRPLSKMVRDHIFIREYYELLTDQVVHWPDFSERLSDAPMTLREALLRRGMKTSGSQVTEWSSALVEAGFELTRTRIESIANWIVANSQSDIVEGAREIFGESAEAKGSTSELTGWYAQVRPELSDVERFLKRVSSHSTTYTISHDGADLLVFPGVFSPRYSHSSDFLIETLQVPAGSSVADMGCGTGVIGLATLRRGADHCLFVDINPDAVENARANIVGQGFEKRGRVIGSDLFERIEGRFDLIVTNPPFWNRKPSSMLERSCFDEDHQFIRRLLSEAPEHLRDDGMLAMVLSDQSDLALVSRLIFENGWRVDGMFHQVAKSPSGQTPHVRIVWHLSIYQ